MARFFTEADVQPEVIRTRKVAIIGYGSQGRAQALNLRDSGLDVVVGLYDGSASWSRAEQDGLTVVTTEEATQKCDVLMLCLPDVKMAAIYERSIAPHLRPNQALLFSHGFNIRYELIQPPKDVDVILVSPKGAGPGVRKNYEEGFGVPALIAIHQDATGNAQDIALGYAWALGSARVMMMETTFREETETDLFGEQAVLCGGLPELIKAGFDTLVEAGYQPEAAYFECLHETKLIVDLLYQRGLTGMREKISDTAEWGGFVSGPRIVDEGARSRMKEVLLEIQNGAFTRKWIEEDAAGRPELQRLRTGEAGESVERLGLELRRKMRLGE